MFADSASCRALAALPDQTRGSAELFGSQRLRANHAIHLTHDLVVKQLDLAILITGVWRTRSGAVLGCKPIDPHHGRLSPMAGNER
jgi:hypothetical protein